MTQFKEGKKPATVMHQLAKGYTDAGTRGPGRLFLEAGPLGAGGQHMSMQRRDFLKAGAAAAALAGLAGCAGVAGGGAKARVVVVGGGYGGATAAKYIRLFDPSIEVVLVEPNEAFISCPISNLVLGGFKTMNDITTPYTGLANNHGVRIVRDMATAIDADKKQVRLAKGETLSYDRVIVSPGIDFMAGAIPALAERRRAGARAARVEGRARRRWRCAASSRTCPTAASTCSPSRRRPTAARRARTSAPARSRPTSRRGSRSRRSSSSTPTPTSPPRGRSSRRPGRSSTRASSSTAATARRSTSTCAPAP